MVGYLTSVVLVTTFLARACVSWVQAQQYPPMLDAQAKTNADPTDHTVPCQPSYAFRKLDDGTEARLLALKADVAEEGRERGTGDVMHAMGSLPPDLARLREPGTFLFSNGGWKYDAYSELESLDAGRTITVADVQGPGAITHIHCTQHFVWDVRLDEQERQALAARGVVLEIAYDGEDEPAVRAPLADFFCDGCGGRCDYFTTLFVEKAPKSYNCFLWMPFARRCTVRLRNDTKYDLANYSFVEVERLHEWDASLGYLHAKWDRFAFQLASDADRPFLRVDGRGHLVGHAWSIATDEPLFRDFAFVMEGNNEVRVDGQEKPTADYLGSEDGFGFAWGWPDRFVGLRNGINFIQHEDPALVSTFRFRTRNVIPFARQLEWRVNWSHEFKGNKSFHKRLAKRVDAGGAWVDYATMYYWYQDTPSHEQGPLMPLDERIRTVLHPNPR